MNLSPWEAHVLIKACEALQKIDAPGEYRDDERGAARLLVARLIPIAGHVTDPA